MKYYSEKTQKLYNSIEELEKADKVYDDKQKAIEKAKADRAMRAKEVEDAYNNYKKLLDEFIKDYGHYHMTINEPESMFDFIFNRWPF